MCNIENKIYELIAGFLNRELDPEEERELQTWLEESAQHRAVFGQIKDLHDQLKSEADLYEPEVESALRRVKKARSYHPVRELFKYAAAVLLLVGMLWGADKLYSEYEEQPSRCFTQVAEPGHGKALLKRWNGSEILLDRDSRMPFVIDSSGFTLTMEESGSLSYVLSDTVIPPGEIPVDKLIVPRGGEFHVTLSDGTRVWLNVSSELTYPQYFTGKERRVKLTGEAYFEVVRNDSMPFTVETPQMDVKVLGTRFNVSAYEDNDYAHATLVEGSVEVSTFRCSPMLLLPGEQAVLNRGETLEKREVDLSLYVSWREGLFIFRNAELEEIAKQISRWYDVDVVFAKEELKRESFTGGMIKFKPIEELIGMIEATSKVRFSIRNKTIIISEE